MMDAGDEHSSWYKRVGHSLDNTLINESRWSRRLNQAAVWILLAALSFIAIWSLVVVLSPGTYGISDFMSSTAFALLVLVFVSLLAGQVVSFARIPPLFGMLLVGIALRNIPVIDIARNVDRLVAANARQAAFTVVLLKAGFHLDLAELRRMKGTCLRLAFVPCVVEGCTVGLVGHFMLDLPFEYSFMLGFVLGAVSPAVLVPLMLFVSSHSLGGAALPTLIIAASSIDDILAIAVFSILLGVTFARGGIVSTLLWAPLQVILGVCFGVFSAAVLWYFPLSTSTHRDVLRGTLLMLVSLTAMFGSAALDISGAGPIAVLVLAVALSHRWTEKERIERVLDYAWVIGQPLLFALIGAEVVLDTIDPPTLGMGTAVLAVGLVTRMLSTFLVAGCGSGFTVRERVFIAIAWLPKATVQAALGPVPLDTLRMTGENNSTSVVEEQRRYCVQILQLAVISIVLTAPLGALLVGLTARCLLSTNTADTSENAAELECLQTSVKESTEEATER